MSAGSVDAPGAGGGPDLGSAPDVDLRAEMLAGAKALRQGAARSSAHGVTSDLSIDETLLLHAVGWEPVDLVFGVCVVSVPPGWWNWGTGEIGAASEAHNLAVAGAAGRMRNECANAGGLGVVGVQVSAQVEPHHIDVELVGTAIRPINRAPQPRGHVDNPFISDLSARDFTLLDRAGWEPVGLAFGTSFVYVPRRSAGTAIRQSGQNVELVNFTQAMYAARESAMERMQRSAISMGGKGIVAVQVTEGPMPFARHAVRFGAWGTSVRLSGESHVYAQPQVVLPMDDAVVQFQAQSLRGAAE